MRVAVITGGSRGIGAAVARRLVRDGHAVCLGYRSDEDGVRDVVGELTAGGGTAVAVRADVTVPAEVDLLFEEASRLGPVTGVVNNAGLTGSFGPLAEVDPELMHRVLDVNLYGALLVARAAVRCLPRGGVLVNVSSAAATLGSPGEYVHYAAAKAGVDALTVGLAKEVGARGILVNAVAPGLVLTGIHAAAGAPDRIDRIVPSIPLGRAGEPAEIAAAIAWFFTPDASYTTGTVLRVAGGR